MSRPSQTESAYVQTFVRSKFFVRSSCVQNSLCPDFRAFKILYDQTLVRSKLKFVRSFVRSKTPMSRLSCVQNLIWPDFSAFQIKFRALICAFKNTYVQTFVRSNVLMSRLSCVQTCLCPDFRAFKILYDQTLVRSKWKIVRSFVRWCPDYRAFKNTYVQTWFKIAFKIAYVQTIVRSKLHMSRLSCVQICMCPDYRAFIFFSRPFNFERTTPPCAFISVWTYRLSVWDLNLGDAWTSFDEWTWENC